jgi:hypothetical protein
VPGMCVLGWLQLYRSFEIDLFFLYFFVSFCDTVSGGCSSFGGERDLMAAKKIVLSAVLCGKPRVQSSPSNPSVLDKLGLPLLIGETLVGQKNLVDAGKVSTSLACLVAAGGN